MVRLERLHDNQDLKFKTVFNMIEFESLQAVMIT